MQRFISEDPIGLAGGINFYAYVESVGKVYGLTNEEMVSGGKYRYPSEARGMIAYLVREVTGMSLTDLGRRMKRDVSSLSLAADKIMRCSKDYGEINKRKRTLEKKFS